MALTFLSHPSRLHHYMTVSSQERLDWLEKLIVEGKAFLRSPLDFNDPFDCLPVLDAPNSAIAWELHGRKYRECLREDFGDQLADEMWAAYKRLPDKRKKELIVEASRLSAQQAGIFCLSEIDDSVLMWSHYSDNHRGILVSFDLSRPPLSDLMLAQPVIYGRDRPHLPVIRRGNDQKRQLEALLSKADFWSYEHEWRVIVAGGAHKHLNFDLASIASITFGARCTDETKGEVRKIASASRSPISFREASMSPQRFELIISDC